jgi:hypothetical protein
VTVTGTSLAGNQFSRTATTTFEVTPPLASFVSFADGPVTGGIAVTANINVQSPGPYVFSFQLQANNQNTAQASAAATLTAGLHQITVTFPSASVFGLGTGGPYKLLNALLTFQGSPGNLVADSRPMPGQPRILIH